jgi:superfamily II DNA/RNA helicase
LTADTDKDTYRLVAEGHFQLVYATPEILIKRGSRFRNIVMTHEGNKFCSSLLTIAIDEAHIKLLWGNFRPEYQELHILREFFPTASIVALSATFSRRMKRHIVESMSMSDPIYIQRSIRRRNICKIVSTIQKPGYGDLDIFLPKDISTPNEIPTTLIFHDSVQGGLNIVQYLRQRLPTHLRNRREIIIRVYAGFLEGDVRALYEQDLAVGLTRIMICTDACGMGVDLRAIKRVVQWKVMSNLSIEGIDQRAGRAGRDRKEPLAIAVTFIHPSLATPLFEQCDDSESTTRRGYSEDEEDNNEININKHHTYYSKGKPPADIAKLQCRLTTPVSHSTKAEVESLLTEIARLSSKSLSSRDLFSKAWYNQDLGGLWYFNVFNGCRHKVLMALFDDPDTFGKDDIESEFTSCCDICIKAALDAGLIVECPVIHGISVSIGLAFQMTKSHLDRPDEVDPVNKEKILDAPLPAKRVRISTARIAKVETDVRAWRMGIATKVIPEYRVLSEKAISKIVKAVRSKEPTEALIREALEGSGISVMTSGIRNHIPALVNVIFDSLARSLGEQQSQIPTAPTTDQLSSMSAPHNGPEQPTERSSSITSGQIIYMTWVQEQGQLQMVDCNERELNGRKRKKHEETHQRTVRARIESNDIPELDASSTVTNLLNC